MGHNTEKQMSDPIRDLWAQCVRKHTKTPMNWQDVADEFAVLIVQHCIDVLYDTEQIEHAQFADRTLKRHFGVGGHE